MADVDERDQIDAGIPWQQKVLDNLWLLLAMSILVPGLMYLLWGLLELANLPTWGGG